MDPNLVAAAQKELLRRKAIAELERRKASAAPAISVPEQVSDFGKSLVTGAGKAAIGMAGGIGDAQQMMGNAAGSAAGYLGAGPEWQQRFNTIGQNLAVPGMVGGMPTSQQLQGGVETVTGDFRQPQSTAGDYGQTIGEFTPALLGPGGMVRKGLSWLVPALTSEGAGQLTKGTMAEPWVRLGTGLLGTVATGGRGGKALKGMREQAPSLETRIAQKNAAYARLDKAGIVFDDNAYRSMAAKVERRLYDHGWRPRDGGVAGADLEKIKDRIGKVNSWQEIDSLRNGIGNLPVNATKTDKARAAIIRDAIDELVASGKLTSTKGVNPDAVQTMAKTARELARQTIIADKLKEMEFRSGFFTSGEESGIRNQAASYGKREGHRLTTPEQTALKSVIRREGLLGILNTTGSKLGQVALGTAGVAGGMGLIPTAIAMGVNLGARKLSEANTKKAVANMIKTVLAGRPAQTKALAAQGLLGNDIAKRRLIGASAGLLGAR